MSEPGLPLEQVFKKVIIGVKADTHGAQQPWSEASIQGDFYFLPKGPGGAAITPVAANSSGSNAPVSSRHVDSASELEQAYWDRIKDSTDLADFKDYQSRYPNGPHVNEAALLARKFNRSVAAAPAAAPVTRTADAKSSLLDVTALGSWYVKIPSPQGVSTCYWDIKADGSYSSWCTGAHPAAHSGTVLIANGKWTLDSTTMVWSDGGSYQFADPNTMIMTGKLGTGAWLRK
jgi:hypothetical protein